MIKESRFIKYAENLTTVAREEFLGKWSADERNKTDGAMKKLLAEHESRTDLAYYSGIIGVDLLSNVVLPHHCHGLEPGNTPDREVKTGGDFFDSVISNYEQFRRNNRFAVCIKHVEKTILRLQIEDGIVDAGFIWMTENKDLAMSDYGNQFTEVIFIGNGFHRMVSIGLINKKQKLIGVKAFFGTKNAG